MSKFSKSQDGSNTLLVIASIYKSLTKTEQKIADIITQDPEMVVYATLTDLAEKAGVGDTSVLRLCRKLGFHGYQEFKLSLAQDLVNPVKSVHSEIEEGDNLSTIANKITAENKIFLENTLALLNMKELQKAIDALANANKIYFIGVGSSANTAADAKYRFMRLGFNTELVIDSHVMAMSATLMTRDDVIFAVSTSGSTKDIVDAVRIAKQNGVFFICLTSHAKSPITQYSNSVLLSCSKETPLQGGAFRSKITQIHVLDILTTAVAIQCKDKALRAIELTAKSISDKMY
ncbi:MurR/RpiR family transcriptional regulator [Paenibacillus psychroresistens]|uniref:MurR/RpiR family transcriptional regulator n=1 Tax=Paenibacillus psychroresistens TaxID=1778678 RepID=A0A6B8REL2_9BACL|nr:MurR/RpiR family transcriptional regulator [Paenibacillus psychroresistens]QGQ93912.1 MurR/RpiR family transcriptional regulator [Paenibacillus psychroresistens]